MISSTYVWQLRAGRRDNPTHRHLSALAAFFGVSPVYFFDNAEAGRDALPAELIAALKDGEVREMALRAAGLSPSPIPVELSMPNSNMATHTASGLLDTWLYSISGNGTLAAIWIVLW